jgi:hypothetical protein
VARPMDKKEVTSRREVILEHTTSVAFDAELMKKEADLYRRVQPEMKGGEAARQRIIENSQRIMVKCSAILAALATEGGDQ